MFESQTEIHTYVLKFITMPETFTSQFVAKKLQLVRTLFTTDGQLFKLLEITLKQI